MVSPSPLATRVSMRNMEVVDDVCRSSLGCGGVDLSTIALVLLTGVLALVVLAAIVHAREAVSVVDEERRRLAAERDAFDAFSRKIAGVEVSESTAPVQAAGGLVAAATTTTTAPDDRIDRIRDAYRDTVMAVPHFDADYGESFSENIAAEFGEGLAVAVLDGGGFTPQVKSALLEASQEARRSRAAFLSTLEAEAAALDESISAMETVDAERESTAEAPMTGRSYEDLVADWGRLGDLSDRCQTLLSERQDRIQALSTSTPSDAPDVYEYLYDGMPVSHPVLSDLASLSEAIDALRSQVLQAITRRV